MSGAAQAQTVAGSTPGSFRVTESGAAEYRIPIRVPPGIAGMEPKLAMVYNSQGGNGPLGMGWSLEGLSAITRCPKTWAQDGMRGAISYDSNDRFCLDGQRLVLIGGSGYGAGGSEYRTERESFSKITASATTIAYPAPASGVMPESFVVKTKSGLTMEYGKTADSRIEAQGKTSVRLWALNKVSDTKGNYYSVTYDEDEPNGDFRLSRIDYTGNGGQSPSASVRIAYEPTQRPDVVAIYVGGSVQRALKRMQSIDVYSGAALLRSYRFAYQLGAATKRSQLLSSTECDAAGNCLPPTTFSPEQLVATGWIDAPNRAPPYPLWYRSNDNEGTKVIDVNGDGLPDVVRSLWVSGVTYATAWINNGSGWTETPGYAPPYPLWSRGLDDEGVMLIDINGDGLPDLVHSIWANGVYQSAWLNNGSGWTEAPQFTPPYYITDRPYGNESTKLVDLNGDGLPDLLYNLWVGDGVTRRNAWLNTGSGWAETPAYAPPYYLWSRGVDDEGMKLIDLNGDGLPDLVRNIWANGTYQTAWINTGSGWREAPEYAPPYHITDRPNGNESTQFVDLNGDGLPDLVYNLWIGDGVLRRNAWLNTGTGWVEAPSYAPPYYLWSRGYDDEGMKFVDINGDGLPDLVRGLWANGQYMSAWLNTGSGWLEAPEYAPPYYITDRPYGNESTQLVDIDGDGMVDLIYNLWVGDGLTRKGAWLNKRPSDRIVSISNGAGIVTTVTYKPLTDSAVYARGSGGAHPIQDVQMPLQVVSSATTSDGVGGARVANYFYSGAKAHVKGFGFLGFRSVESTDQSSGLKVRTEYRQDWPYLGMPSLARKSQSSGAMLSEVTNTYLCINPANGAACAVAIGNRYFPFLSQSLETGNDLNAAPLPTVTTTMQYGDGFGNATSVVVSTGDGYSKTTTNVYNNDTTNWLLGRLKNSTVQSTIPTP
jgi:hypothetical protein